MVINKRQRYLPALLLATILSANIQSVSALNTDPVVSSENSAVLLSNSQITTLVAASNATVTHAVTNGLPRDNHAKAVKVISTQTNPNGKTLLMLASEYKQNVEQENTDNTLTETVSNQSTSQPSGSFVSTNYNTMSMLRKMEDQQNIGYLDMSSTEPISDALNRELKATTQIALVTNKSCNSLKDRKLLLACQDKNVEKAMAMPMVRVNIGQHR
jgi:hypothetical protein